MTAVTDGAGLGRRGRGGGRPRLCGCRRTHHTALRLYGVNSTASVSPLRGDKEEYRLWQ